MDFIKKFFDEFKTTPETDRSTTYTIRTLDPSEYGMFDFGAGNSEESDAYFTQAELQQLKVVLSECVTVEESCIEMDKEYIEYYKGCGYNKSDYSDLYPRIRKSKKRIKMLANLLYKVKHTIETRG